jgi:hypothetical protein
MHLHLPLGPSLEILDQLRRAVIISNIKVFLANSNENGVFFLNSSVTHDSPLLDVHILFPLSFQSTTNWRQVTLLPLSKMSPVAFLQEY